MSQVVTGPRKGVATYPPCGDGWPWLVVVFDQRGVEAFTYETESDARRAQVEKAMEFMRDQSDRESRQES